VAATTDAFLRNSRRVELKQYPRASAKRLSNIGLGVYARNRTGYEKQGMTNTLSSPLLCLTTKIGAIHSPHVHDLLDAGRDRSTAMTRVSYHYLKVTASTFPRPNLSD
jgi:hypothetical protein